MLGMYDGVEIPEEATQQLEQVVGMFGGVEGIVGWIGDVAVVVNDPGEGFEGGLLIQPTDATKAENLFLSIRGMLSLGGASLGLAVTDEQHGDATITTLDFGGAPDADEHDRRVGPGRRPRVRSAERTHTCSCRGP